MVEMFPIESAAGPRIIAATMTTPFRMSNVDYIQFVIVPKIKPYCGPLFFTRSLEKAAGNVIANGSYGLVDTGQKKLLVTCRHVLEEFRQMLAIDPDLKFCICLDRKNPIVFDIRNLIDEDRSADLATFDMQPMLSICDGRSFFRISCGHIHPVKKDDRLVFIGYPGRHRSDTDEGIIFGTTPHVAIAKDVSQYGLIVDTSQMMNVDRQLVSEQHENPFGGVSGSPCFLMQNYTFVHLVAFVTGDLKQQQLLQFTSANRLNADGTINR